MSRVSKDSKPIIVGVRVNRSEKSALERHCESSGLTISEVLRAGMKVVLGDSDLENGGE